MKYLHIALISLAALAAGAAAQPDTGAAGDAQEQIEAQTFLVIYRPGPAYDPAKPVRGQALGGHGKYLLNLYKAGEMKAAGPFTDDWGGGVILSVADQEAAETIARNDPAVLSGVFIWEVHPWDLVPWDQYVK